MQPPPPPSTADNTAASAAPPRPAAAGRTRSHYLDTLIGLMVLTAVNLFWFGSDPGFFRISPHPFWLVILPVATRYGFRAGLSAGILAAVLFVALVALGHSDQPVSDTWALFMEQGRYRSLVLFVAAGMLIGEISQIQKNRFQALQTEYNDLRESFTRLSAQYSDLSRAKEELDTRIISQEQTVSGFYEAAQALRSLDEREIYPGVIELVRNFTSAQACSVYQLYQNRLLLEAAWGDPPGVRRAEEVPPEEGMMGSAVATGSPVSIRTLKISDPLGIIISAPLKNSRDQVLGVVNIEKLPFVKFTPATIQMTGLIAEWAGSAIENARTYRETKDQNISDDVTGAYTHQYAEKRLQEEFLRARRYQYPSSLLLFEIVSFHVFSEAVKADTLQVLSSIFLNKIRKNIDLLFHDRNPSRYMIFLPNTPLGGARILMERILAEIDAFKFRPFEDEERLLEVWGAADEIRPEMNQAADLIRSVGRQMPFRKRLRAAFENARSAEEPFSILGMEIDAFYEMGQRTKEDILIFLGGIFAHRSAAPSQVYHLENPARFAILLPGLTAPEAHTFRDELMAEIDAFDIRPFDDAQGLSVRAGVAQVTPELRDAEHLLARVFGDTP